MNQQKTPNANEFFCNQNYFTTVCLFVNKMTHQSDVLLMFEREHYGDVAIQNPDELSQHVEIEGKVDHGEEAGALGHRGVD